MGDRLYSAVGSSFRCLIACMGSLNHPIGYSEWYDQSTRRWNLMLNITYNHETVYSEFLSSPDITMLYNQANEWLTKQVRELRDWK